MSYERPVVNETTPQHELLGLDNTEQDTAIVAGTRKLMMVMFTLLKIEIPSEDEIDNYITEVTKDY